MWMVCASGSALFARVTSILAICGIEKTDSNVATAIRTIVVLLFSWDMVFITGSQTQIFSINSSAIFLLVLSGLATGASWLCYFHALQIGDVNKVVPVDKSSILLAFFLLGEPISATRLTGLAGIGMGTFLMIEPSQRSKNRTGSSHGWFLYAAGAAVFAALTSILGKIGISLVESNLGAAIGTGIVLIMAWIMVFVTGKQNTLPWRSSYPESCCRLHS